MNDTIKRFVAFRATGLVKGQPRTKSRAFKNKAGRIISGVYTPATAKSWKSLVSIAAIESARECLPAGTLLSGPLKSSITVWMPRPRSHFRPGKNSHLMKLDAPTWYSQTPDNDNIEKAIWDAISDTGVVWKDDKQIACNITRVLYGDEPGASVSIEEL